MHIKDLQSGKVREYGTNSHDSLRISSDGRTLTYYNLQNGDGSCCGDYRFCDENGNLPCDIPFSEGYFNIGGFDKVVRCESCINYASHGKRCKFWNHGVKADDYCSYGVRKE